MDVAKQLSSTETNGRKKLFFLQLAENSAFTASEFNISVYVTKEREGN